MPPQQELQPWVLRRPERTHLPVVKTTLSVGGGVSNEGRPRLGKEGWFGCFT